MAKRQKSVIKSSVASTVVDMLKAKKTHKEIIEKVKKKHKLDIRPQNICAIRLEAGIDSTRQISKKKRAHATRMVANGMTLRKIQEHIRKKYGSALEATVLRDIRRAHLGKSVVNDPIVSDSSDVQVFGDATPAERQALRQFSVESRINKLLSTLCNALAREGVTDAVINVKERSVKVIQQFTSEVKL